MKKSDFLFPDLSYKLYGIFLTVKKRYGCMYKEEVYHKACSEELSNKEIQFDVYPKIKIYSQISDKIIGEIIPDFIIENKIIVEIKAIKRLNQSAISQLYKYLENSTYELGYLVNFGTSYIQIIRKVYSNSRKPFIKYI